MPVVITFEDFQPVARYDSLPWTHVRIEESATQTGTYAAIETVALSPLDVDPSDPAVRDFTTENATAQNLWYRLIFVDADGDESAPTAPIQNTTTDTIYATANELARILKIRTPTNDQTVAMNRVLIAAAGEINSEIDRASTSPISGWQLSLAAEVNLERAAELWKEQEVQFGLVGIGSEFGATRIATNTWEKYAVKLAPLKGQWGFA